MPAPRVISLLPSATEAVCALGLGECLVGRSHECDFPPEVRQLPAVTVPELNAGATSGEIHRQVTDRAALGRSVYRIDEASLRALRPDVILTQDHCGVCAVGKADVARVLESWGGDRPRVVSLSPQRLPEVWTSIQEVADALGVTERGRALLKSLKTRVADIILRTAALEKRPTVVCLEWLDPLMAAGNWVPELAELAGGVNLLGEGGKPSDWLGWEQLIAADPKVLVALPCGFDLARTEHEWPALTRRAEWPKLRAVRRGRVAIADGSQFFNRPGPRLVESLEILAEILHPKLFRFGHEGRGWRLAPAP